MDLTDMFMDFLKSNEKTFTLEKENEYPSKFYIVKLPYSDYIDMLYMTHTYKENLSNHSKLEYCGFFDKEKQELYDIGYYLRKDILKLEWNDNTYKEMSSLTDEYNKKMSEVITSYILENKKEFYECVKEYNSDSSKRDVYHHIINNTDKVKYEYSYTTERFNEVLDYMANGEGYLTDRALEVVEKHKEYIGKRLIDNDKTNELLNEVINDETDVIHKRKDIVNAVNGGEYGNVHVYINKDGINFDFKYPADTLSQCYDTTYLSTYNLSAPDRDKFYELFGRHSDFYYEEIYKLEYRNKPIYEDKEFVKSVNNDEGLIIE